MAAIDQLLRHKIFLQRFAAGQANDWKRLIRQTVFKLEQKLKYGTISLQELDRYTDAIFITLNKLIYRSSLDDMTTLLQYETDFNYKILNKTVEPTLKKPDVSTKTLEGTKITPNVGTKSITLPTLHKSLALNVANTINQKVRNAKLMQEIEEQKEEPDEERISSLLVLGLVAGLKAIEGPLRSVSNTVVNHTSFVAMDELIAANDDVIHQVVWVSALDDSVCEECSELEGRSWALEDFEDTPPLHFGCRCLLAPVEVINAVD